MSNSTTEAQDEFFFEALDVDRRPYDKTQKSVSRPSEPSSDKQKSNDPLRIHLIQVAYLLSAAFMDKRYWQGVKTQSDTFEKLTQVLAKLNAAKAVGSDLLIRHRGFQTGTKVSSKNDYVIRFGSITLDSVNATALIKRLGIKMSHLSGRLGKAFAILADQGINSLYLHFPGPDVQQEEELKTCLEIIAQFQSVVKTGSDMMALSSKDGKLMVPLVQDSGGQPDPNLTMVAGLNGLSAEKMMQLLGEIDDYVRKIYKPSVDQPPPAAYELLFRIKNFGSKLKRPLIEINNVRWLMLDSGQKIVSIDNDDTSQPKATPPGAEIPLGILTAAKSNASTAVSQVPNGGEISQPPNGLADGPDGSLEKVPQSAIEVIAEPGVETVAVDKRWVTFFEKHLGGTLRENASVIQSVYEDDYEKIDTQGFAQRIKKLTSLLHSLENNPKGGEILDQVIDNIQVRLEQVRDDVFDEMEVVDGAIRFQDQGKPTVIEKVHSRVLGLISLFKERSATQKKIEVIRRSGLDFEACNYAEIAQRFHIDRSEVEHIIGLLHNCFDQRGYFLRTMFEARIPEFLTYEKKIFEFLWAYLKQTRHRNDRVAFLNSLQLLINQMKQPQKALRFLLADLCRTPNRVSFSDRNALMLGSILIRNYNKELNIDIELTPEEVLSVKRGIDRSIAQYASWRIDVDNHRFEDKISTIHEQLVDSLSSGGASDISLSPRFLLSLEREAFIFLSLVAGRTARQIILDACVEYGDPEADIYHSDNSPDYLPHLLKHLQVVIRAMGRVGQLEDLSMLADFMKTAANFSRMNGHADIQGHVRRLLSTAETAMKNLTAL